MFKKIKNFLFGAKTDSLSSTEFKFAPENYNPVRAPAKPSIDWDDAAKLKTAIESVASARVVTNEKLPIVEIESKLTVAPNTTKKKRTYKKREKKVETQWPFPIEKPLATVTPEELEALKVDPIAFQSIEEEKSKPAAMKVRKPRKAAFIPKQD